MDAGDLINSLGLKPHPEGGWYREVYRSATRVETPRGARSAVTTIYYLLERQQMSRWHVVEADEIWHFYAGAGLELLAYDPSLRRLVRHALGPVDQAFDRTQAFVSSNEKKAHLGQKQSFEPTDRTQYREPVAVVEKGVWQAARSLGDYSLVGCTVGPGFEFDDFRFVATLPGHAVHFEGELASLVQLL